MVIAVGCTVLQMWRDGVPWALQVRVLRAPAVTGHVAIPDPLDGVLAYALRRSGSHEEIPDPSRGKSRPPAASAGHPSPRGRVVTPDPNASRRRVWGHTCDEVVSGQPELAEQ